MEKIQFELKCVDTVQKPIQEGEKWTKFALVNKNKYEVVNNEGDKVPAYGAQEGELQNIAGKFLGDSDFIQQGKKYLVTIEEIG
jgi:peroxiredoxin